MRFRHSQLENPDALFTKPDGRRHGIRLIDLPYIARPIIERFHQEKPDIVIAGDRGGRLFAYAAFQSWKRRFPGEPFPTHDQKIHFARVSSRSAEEREVRGAVHYTLEKAGLPPDWQRTGAMSDGSPPKVAYMDDWIVHGGTVRRFIGAANGYGLPDSALLVATMCGPTLTGGGVNHIVGDPDRHPRTSDWNDDSAYSGVRFPYADAVTPRAFTGPDSSYARQEINRQLDAYYERFSAVLAAAGQTAMSGS